MSSTTTNVPPPRTATEGTMYGALSIHPAPSPERTEEELAAVKYEQKTDWEGASADKMKIKKLKATFIVRLAETQEKKFAQIAWDGIAPTGQLVESKGLALLTIKHVDVEKFLSILARDLGFKFAAKGHATLLTRNNLLQIIGLQQYSPSQGFLREFVPGQRTLLQTCVKGANDKHRRSLLVSYSANNKNQARQEITKRDVKRKKKITTTSDKKKVLASSSSNPVSVGSSSSSSSSSSASSKQVALPSSFLLSKNDPEKFQKRISMLEQQVTRLIQLKSKQDQINATTKIERMNLFTLVGKLQSQLQTSTSKRKRSPGSSSTSSASPSSAFSAASSSVTSVVRNFS